MLSLRMLRSAVPKAVFRPTPLRCLSSASKSNFLRPTWQSIKRPSYPAFSTSIVRREPAGESDQVLSEKFNLERQLELDSRDTSKVPASIEDFLQNSEWSLEDNPGTHEVTMTKTFGNETVKVQFSITDMDDSAAEEEFEDLEDDAALSDEEFEKPKKTINQSGVKGGKVDVMPEDSIAPSDRESSQDAENELPVAYSQNLIITITKPGNRAIEIRAVSQYGTITTDSINYFPNAGLIDAKTPEEAQESRSLYAGPPFGNLDPDLQAMFEGYLEERGINAQLAAFLPEYVDYKEQREYVDWLANMKSFIDA